MKLRQRVDKDDLSEDEKVVVEVDRSAAEVAEVGVVELFC